MPRPGAMPGVGGTRKIGSDPTSAPHDRRVPAPGITPRGHPVAGDKQRSKAQRQGEEEKDEEMGWVPATCFSVLFLFPDCMTRVGRAMFCSLGQKPCFVTLTDFPWLISAMTWHLRQSWGEAWTWACGASESCRLPSDLQLLLYPWAGLSLHKRLTETLFLIIPNGWHC